MRGLLVLTGFIAVVAAVVEGSPVRAHAKHVVASDEHGRDTTLLRRRVREVTVHITCANGGVNASVWPWIVRESAGTELSWRVLEAGNVDSILIRNVSRNAPWVLDSAPPYRARRGQFAHGGRLQVAAGAWRSQYAIEFWCRNDGAGEPVHGVIDPDIIVIQ